MKTATTTTTAGETITATLDGDRVSIDHDGVWSGDGEWHNGTIVDCAACMGADDDETQDIYTRLESQLRD